jgi:hypothetical protein
MSAGGLKILKVRVNASLPVRTPSAWPFQNQHGCALQYCIVGVEARPPQVPAHEYVNARCRSAQRNESFAFDIEASFGASIAPSKE